MASVQLKPLCRWVQALERGLLRELSLREPNGWLLSFVFSKFPYSDRAALYSD
jgi:hypothetical protein